MACSNAIHAVALAVTTVQPKIKLMGIDTDTNPSQTHWFGYGITGYHPFLETLPVRPLDRQVVAPRPIGLGQSLKLGIFGHFWTY